MSRLHRLRGFSAQPGELMASEEDLCSMWLGSYTFWDSGGGDTHGAAYCCSPPKVPTGHHLHVPQVDTYSTTAPPLSLPHTHTHARTHTHTKRYNAKDKNFTSSTDQVLCAIPDFRSDVYELFLLL